MTKIPKSNIWNWKICPKISAKIILQKKFWRHRKCHSIIGYSAAFPSWGRIRGLLVGYELTLTWISFPRVGLRRQRLLMGTPQLLSARRRWWRKKRGRQQRVRRTQGTWACKLSIASEAYISIIIFLRRITRRIFWIYNNKRIYDHSI